MSHGSTQHVSCGCFSKQVNHKNARHSQTASIRLIQIAKTHIVPVIAEILAILLPFTTQAAPSPATPKPRRPEKCLRSAQQLNGSLPLWLSQVCLKVVNLLRSISWCVYIQIDRERDIYISNQHYTMWNLGVFTTKHPGLKQP